MKKKLLRKIWWTKLTSMRNACSEWLNMPPKVELANGAFSGFVGTNTSPFPSIPEGTGFLNNMSAPRIAIDRGCGKWLDQYGAKQAGRATWLVNAKMRETLERIDSSAFVFSDQVQLEPWTFGTVNPQPISILRDEDRAPIEDIRMPQGPHWLCDLVRFADALDLDSARPDQIRLRNNDAIEPGIFTKDFPFRAEALEGVHIFRLATAPDWIGCDDIFRDAMKAGGFKKFDFDPVGGIYG